MGKAMSWPAAMILALSAGAAELAIPPNALDVSVPYGKYYTQSVISYRGNAIRIGKVPGLQIQSLFCLSELTPGEQRLRFTGRAFSPESSATVTLTAFGLHPVGGECSQTSSRRQNKFQFQLRLPADQQGFAEFPFQLDPQKLLCLGCGKPLNHCHVTFSLTIDKLPPRVNPDEWGFDLAEIRLTATSPLAAQLQPAGLTAEIAKEQKRFDRWQQEHLAILKRYPTENRFDASAYPGGKNSYSRGLPPDAVYRYFTEAELQRLNPLFQVKKLAGWNFYQEDVYWQIFPEIAGFENVSRVFQRAGVLYGCAPYQLARWNPGEAKWEYLSDEWRHRPVKTFPDAADEIFIENNTARRLSDYSEVKLPARSRHQYATAGKRTFQIAPERQALLVGAADFSNPQPLELPLPQISGARAVEIRNLYPCADRERLLVEYTAFLPNNATPVLMELDAATLTLTPKLPAIAGNYSLQIQENNWSFLSGIGTLFDPGKGQPLTMLRDAPPLPEETGVTLPRLGITARQAKALRKSLRLGVYAVADVTDEHGLIWLNLVNPAESLRFFGLEQRLNLGLNEDGTALLAVMPDGVYEIRPKQLPEMPAFRLEIRTAPELPAPAELVTEIESDSPALFRAEKQDGKIIFLNRPAAAATAVRLRLALTSDCESYLLRFDSPVRTGFHFTAERADGEAVECSWIDPQTLRISCDTALLHVELQKQQESRRLKLESIAPVKSQRKGTTK